MAPLAGPRSVIVPLSGTGSRTGVAKGGHGQRKGLAYPQQGRSVQPGQETEFVTEALIRPQQAGCPRRDLPRPPDRELAMRTRRIWTLLGPPSRAGLRSARSAGAAAAPGPRVDVFGCRLGSRATPAQKETARWPTRTPRSRARSGRRPRALTRTA